MNKMAMEGIEILDAELNYIEFQIKEKQYRLDVNLNEYLENSGLLDCSEDKWSYSSGHYTNDWTISAEDYLQDVSIMDVAEDYLKDSFDSLDKLLVGSEELEC